MKKSNIFLLIIFLIFVVYSLINIKETNSSTMNVLKTFSKNILPALLPFLIINQLVIKLGIIDLLAYLLQFISYPLFKISGKGASVIMIGLLNGFPSSAIFTSLMLKDNQIEKEEAQRLINSVFFPSISFLFVIINTNLNNQTLFNYLVTSIYLSGFIILYISSFKTNSKEKAYITFSQTLAIIKNKLNNFIFIKSTKDAITYAFTTLINILGIITIFSIPCNIINNIFSNDIRYFFQGIIEFSIPSIKLSSLNINKKTIALILSSILSFSSLSSIIQATLFISEVKLSSKSFLTYRVIISLLTVSILYLFLFFL